MIEFVFRQARFAVNVVKNLQLGQGHLRSVQQPGKKGFGLVAVAEIVQRLQGE